MSDADRTIRERIRGLEARIENRALRRELASTLKELDELKSGAKGDPKDEDKSAGKTVESVFDDLDGVIGGTVGVSHA